MKSRDTSDRNGAWLMALLPAVLIALIPSPVRPQDAISKVSSMSQADQVCLKHLKHIYKMIKAFEHHSGTGQFPRRLESVFQMTRDRELFLCPLDVPVPDATDSGHLRSSYELVNNPRRDEVVTTPADRVAIVSEKRAHHEGKRLVLFYDGCVKKLNSAQFEKLRKNGFVDEASDDGPARDVAKGPHQGCL